MKSDVVHQLSCCYARDGRPLGSLANAEHLSLADASGADACHKNCVSMRQVAELLEQLWASGRREAAAVLLAALAGQAMVLVRNALIFLVKQACSQLSAPATRACSLPVNRASGDPVPCNNEWHSKHCKFC